MQVAHFYIKNYLHDLIAMLEKQLHDEEKDLLKSNNEENQAFIKGKIQAYGDTLKILKRQAVLLNIIPNDDEKITLETARTAIQHCDDREAMDAYKCYLQTVTDLLIKALNRLAREITIKKENKIYDQGQIMGYYDVLTVIKSDTEIFGAPLKSLEDIILEKYLFLK